MRVCIYEEVIATPGGSVQLKGEDDVIGVAHLADEAPLGAKVTVEHVVGGELYQRCQVGGVLVFSDLDQSETHTHTRRPQPVRGATAERQWVDSLSGAPYLPQVRHAVQVSRLQQVRPLLHPASRGRHGQHTK